MMIKNSTLNLREKIVDQENRINGAIQHKKNKSQYFQNNQNNQNKGDPTPDDYKNEYVTQGQKKYKSLQSIQLLEQRGKDNNVKFSDSQIEAYTFLDKENYQMKIKNNDKLPHNLEKLVNEQPNNLNDISSLVLSGGGAKGISYLLMLDVLDADQFQIIAGSSAGALTAFCLAIGLSIEECKKIIKIPLKDTISEDTKQTYGNKNSFKALYKMNNIKEDHSSSTDKIKSILKKAIRAKLSKLLNICILLRKDVIYQSIDEIDKQHENQLYVKSYNINKPDIINNVPDEFNVHNNDIVTKTDLLLKQIAEANITLDTYSLKKYWGEDKDNNKLAFKLEVQNTVNLLNDLLNKKEDFDYSFKDHEKVRAACSKIHIDPKMKDLLVTATKLNKVSDPNSPASDSLTVFRTGDKKFDNVSMIQASAASGCFPGVLEPEKINGQIYVDGGIVDNKPISEPKKYVEEEYQKNEVIKIISQLEDLNGVEQNAKDAIIKKFKENKNYSPNVLSVDIGEKPGTKYNEKHKLDAVGASYAINIINKVISYCEGAENLKIPTNGYGEFQKKKNKVVKALIKNKQLTEANIIPSGVETLTEKVTDKQLENMCKAIIDEIKKMVRKFNDRINKR